MASHHRLLKGLSLALPLLAQAGAPAWAQTVTGVVVDATDSVLQGATVSLCQGSKILATATTGADGRFVLEGAGDRIVISLTGFESVTLPLGAAGHVVLPLARSADTVEVASSVQREGVAGAAAFAGEMSRETMRRLPAASQKVRDSLPLLPGVLRGPDGLLRVNGARPHEAPLLLDGFDVTDPTSGVSTLDPPLESVQATQILRDPMDVALGPFIGGAVAIDSRSGGTAPEYGVEGFLPRPRLGSGGFGTIEGFSPRIYAGGSARGGTVRYFASGEYDFDRIPVPGVTRRSSDPNLVAQGGTSLVRVDLLGVQHTMTLEGFVFPMSTTNLGLSPLRTPAASPSLETAEGFAGIVDRRAFADGDSLSLRLGANADSSELGPQGAGPAIVTPNGWRGNSLSTTITNATRYSASAEWAHRSGPASASPEVTVFVEGSLAQLSGSVAEGPVAVKDEAGRVVRTVDFGGRATLAAAEITFAGGLSGTWQPSDRLQLQGGARLDWSSLAGVQPSARVGARYALDDVTSAKIGLGRFVGRLPLGLPAFANYPQRLDRSFDAATGELLTSATLQPFVGELRLPSANTLTAELERQLSRSFDGVVRVTDRRSFNLPTLEVPGTPGHLVDGQLVAASSGSARYWELQLAGRVKWGDENQLLVSYVRSSAKGELNDFETLFHDADPPLLQPGGLSPLTADSPHRVLCWGTVSLPWSIVVSPAVEWHSGFPWSALDVRQFYSGRPQSASFPSFLSLDSAVSKRLTIKSHHVKLEAQVFGLTGHFNPRDVYPVVGSTRFGTFTNSVGLVTRGDIGIDW